MIRTNRTTISRTVRRPGFLCPVASFSVARRRSQRGNFAGRGGISGELRARLKNFFSDSQTASLHSGDTLCYTVKKLDFSCDKEADVCFAS